MSASKYSRCNMEENTKEFKLCSIFKHSLNGKDKVYGPMEYSPNGKGIMAQVDYILIVYSPNGKGMVL